MMDLRFHHVGLACRSLESERTEHVALGYAEEGGIFEDPVQRIRGQFLVLDGFRIELVQPTTADSPLHPWLRRGHKMYHQAFTTRSLSASIETLSANRAVLIVPPTPAVAFAGRSIAFLMLRSELLVELIESP